MHLGIGVEPDLKVEMPVGERDQQQTLGAQDRLRHAATVAHRQRRSEPRSVGRAITESTRMYGRVDGASDTCSPLRPGAREQLALVIPARR